jgi:acyl transferase domain-containing protein
MAAMGMRLSRLLLLAATVLLTASADQPHVPVVVDFVEGTIRPWASDPIIIKAVETQNRITASLDDTAIRAMDQTWRAEVQSDLHPMIDKVLSTPLSAFLRQKQDLSDGSITEIFVMDANGLNVGQSEITSDYWQGDEAKFIEGWRAVGGRVFVEGAEKDESTQMVQSPASIAITDESGKPIGVITIGINLDQL